MRLAFALNAALAWVGVALNIMVAVLSGDRQMEIDPGLYGSRGGGAWTRIGDNLSYFTIWSTIVVALSTTLLALAPDRDTPLRRTLRACGLVMITVTGIVYAVLLAPNADLQGWARVSNPWVHILVPVVTVLVWLIWGPRGWLTWRAVLAALTLPIAWLVFALGRGAIEGLYPYSFMNVPALGWPRVLTTIAGILAFAAVVGGLYRLIEIALGRRHRGEATP